MADDLENGLGDDLQNDDKGLEIDEQELQNVLEGGEGEKVKEEKGKEAGKDKLLFRAQRFGFPLTHSTTNKSQTDKAASHSQTIKELTSPEALKKRQQRFGSVSPVVQLNEFEEKKKKRAEKFAAAGEGGKIKAGRIGNNIRNGNNPKYEEISHDANWEAKLARAQRFGLITPEVVQNKKEARAARFALETKK